MKIQQLVTPDWITKLEHNQVIVVGTNTAGIHGGGAARQAHESFGARWGYGEGLYGNSYALPTVKGDMSTHTIGPKLSLDEIQEHVNKFVECALAHPQLTFFTTEIGCGLAGWEVKDIAPLFLHAAEIENIALPQRFLDVLNE